MKTIKQYFLLFVMLAGAGIANARQHDTTRLIRDFVSISNGYKQDRFYLNVLLRNTTNFITDNNDTLAANGEFYITPSVSYIRFGNIEQIVNDSFALMINDSEERMVMYNSSDATRSRLNMLNALQTTDSSITDLGRKYQASAQSLDSGKSKIVLQSRAILPGTSLPLMVNELVYDVSMSQPVMVKTTRRNLVHVDSSDLPAIPASLTIVQIEKEHYILKETYTTCSFVSIVHDAAMQSPVKISDRVYRNETGDFTPLGSLSHYQLLRF